MSRVVRTLGTGVSPYNGLANSTRPLPIARNQQDRPTSDAAGRAESGCSADVYAPEYAPHPTGFASIRSSISAEALPAVSIESFNPTAMSRFEWRPVFCSPGSLRLHRALEELGWTGGLDEFNDATTRLTHTSDAEPILITANGTILSGFGPWRSAVLDGRLGINCIERLLNEEESLQFILTHHQRRSGWNDFIRIRLALALEPHLQQRAVDNMRAGGRFKGSANLPEARYIDVRDEIANVAGVCPRNVSDVKTLLKVAHPRLTEGLQDGTLRIHRAIQFCKLPRAEQLEEFIRHSKERATNKVIRRSIPSPPKERADLDILAVLEALRCQESRQPGSVALRVSRHKRTVVLVGHDLLSGALSRRRELTLT
jgi:hypothetical protein